MGRLKLNYFINVVLLILLLVVFLTGLIKFPGLIQIFGRDLPMRGITFIHDWAGLLFGILLIVHVILHWSWIVGISNMIFKGNKD